MLDASVTSTAHRSTPSPRPSSTIPPRPKAFTAHDSLSKIREIFAEPASRAALVGAEGVGKSQIALEYAHQVRDESPDTWTFWVPADTREKFEDGYRRIAEVARLDGWDDHQIDLLPKVHKWLSDSSNGQWVMIVDHTEDSSLFFPPSSLEEVSSEAEDGADNRESRVPQYLADFLPQSPSGALLFTSRNRGHAYRLTRGVSDIIHVGAVKEYNELPNLLREFGMLDGNRKDMVAFLRRFDRALEESPSAAQLLCLISQFANYEIQNVLSSYISFYLKRNPTLKMTSLFLVSYSLLQRSTDEENEICLWMDPLERSAMQKCLELSGELHKMSPRYLSILDLEQWQQRFIHTLASLISGLEWKVPNNSDEKWLAMEALYPHTKVFLEYYPTDECTLDALFNIIFFTARYASEAGDKPTAELFARRALEITEVLHGPDSRPALLIANLLAIIVDDQGRYDEAEEIHRRCLKGLTDLFGAGHNDTLSSANNLAVVLRKVERYEEAAALQRRVVQAKEKALGKDHPDTFTSVSLHGLLLNDQGKSDEALRILQSAFERCESLLGIDDPTTLSLGGDLAKVLQDNGQLEKALLLYERVLEGREKIYRLDHVSTLWACFYVGAYKSRINPADGLSLLERATSGHVRQFGHDHPNTKLFREVYSGFRCQAGLEPLPERRVHEEVVADPKKDSPYFQE